MVLDGSAGEPFEFEFESVWEGFKQGCLAISDAEAEDAAAALTASVGAVGGQAVGAGIRRLGRHGSKQAARPVAESVVSKAVMDIEAVAVTPMLPPAAKAGSVSGAMVVGGGGGGGGGSGKDRSNQSGRGGARGGEGGGERLHHTLLVCSWQAGSQLDTVRVWEQTRRERDQQLQQLPGSFQLTEVHMVSGLPHVPLYNPNWMREQLLVCPR